MQVLGGRELLRNEVLAELSKAADAHDGPKFLHIVVKLADVESVYFNTSSGRELRAGQDSARPRSALTAALAKSPKKSVDVESSRYVRSAADSCWQCRLCLCGLLKVYPMVSRDLPIASSARPHWQGLHSSDPLTYELGMASAIASLPDVRHDCSDSPRFDMAGDQSMLYSCM